MREDEHRPARGAGKSTGERDRERERASANAALVARIQAGDARAEEELVERFGPGLQYLLWRLAGDRAMADDLYQETFRIALEKVRSGELREPEKLPGFLRGTAKNLVKSGLSRSRRAEPGETSAGAAPPEPSDPGPDPLRRLLLSEEIGLAGRLLAELPSERDRQVLLRFCVAEEDKSAICADLGLTGLQFNVVLFRARARFKNLFRGALAAGAGRS